MSFPSERSVQAAAGAAGTDFARTSLAVAVWTGTFVTLTVTRYSRFGDRATSCQRWNDWCCGCACQTAATGSALADVAGTVITVTVRALAIDAGAT